MRLRMISFSKHYNPLSLPKDKEILLLLGHCLNELSNLKVVINISLIDVFAWSDYLSYTGKLSVTVRDAAANALEAGLKYYDAVFYLPFDKNATKEERAVDRIIQDYISDVKVSNRKQNIIKLSGDLKADINKVKAFIKSKT